MSARYIKRVLITGASGFVGREVCIAAVRMGIETRGAVRTPVDLPLAIESCVVGGVDGQTDWTEALREVDVVIHLAARVHVMQETSVDPLSEFRKVNVQGTENLARQAVRAGVRRLVYISSIGVNGLQTSPGNSFSEADEPKPHNAYALSKWEAEQALLKVAQEDGLEVVIVRPPLVYGPDAPGNFDLLVKLFRYGIPLPFSSVRNRRSLIYVGNLADALIACATHPVAAGGTYLVSDGEDVSTPDLLRRLGVAMGHPARLFPCFPFWLVLAGRLTGRGGQVERLLGSLQVDSGKIRRDLGWAPPYTLERGLSVTAERYRKSAHSRFGRLASILRLGSRR